GKGIIGAKAKDEDFTERMFVSSTHDDLLCFTDSGRVFKIKVYEIPEAPRTSRGRAIVNILNLKPDERCVEFMPISDFEKHENYLAFATRNGLVKRTSLKDYRNVHSGGLIALNLRDGDSLIGVTWTAGDDHLLLATDAGMAIRFSEQDVRVMGRTASGVKGIDLAGDATVVSVAKIPRRDDEDGFEEADLLTLTVNGYGKRTPTTEYLVQLQDGTTRPQGRGGKGRADIRTTSRNGKVVSALLVDASDDLMLITRQGMIVRTAAGSVSQLGRNTQGVRVISLRDGDALMAVAGVADANGEDVEDA
ncbi:MAG: DNA gyrase C-terminal beta-propeller domain-containing protein, partial [Planctomycetota bacterium]